MPQPTIVFDFDGTLALGHGPVIAYAKHVGLAAQDPGLVDDARAALERLDAGDGRYRDGYDAVRRVALARGVPETALGPAYLASRQELGTQDAPVSAPVGLRDFLAALAQHALLVLATNAPEIGVDRVLDQAGVTHLLAERHFSIGKPDGLTAVVAQHVTHGPVLAVGDIWMNDLAPAAVLGADTALVGATARSTDADPTMRGSTLADLYGEITSWAATAVTGPTASTGAVHPHGKA
ncbi:haloacid dehalogenase-like hydrolase [Isoptericola sp. b441]|uniref:Haloacid dehalogenase-like hydrolase n=1 Tax=Actinotalea lenta TaxID=3064654 RepID=A0ABT9D9X8_9CELL|nr:MULTISPECIES: HAD family hydrolase [unclassified Isoptericola]MDO8107707.1 haloacid dehalogenase-like hydrolase [Isoptericola sp. b441]MDO8120622.1 haloacid dehalogenase-like hydrolase [Isoptericola sp. b490]